MTTKPTPENSLLDKNGRLLKEGIFVTPPVYNRNAIKHNRINISERECFYIANRKFGLYISVCDKSLTGYISIILVDFENMTVMSRTLTKFLPFGKMKMPQNPNTGEVFFSNEKCGALIVSNGSEKYIKCDFIDFYDSKNLYINLTLRADNLVDVYSAADFGENRFEYNCFGTGMLAKGVVRIGGVEYTAGYEKTYAFHIFERGNNKLSANDAYLYANYYLKDRMPFSLRLKDSENSAALNNCAVYNKCINKLGKIRSSHNENSIKSSYSFKEIGHALNITFTPLDNNKDYIMRATAYDRMVIFGRIEGDMILNKNISVRFNRLPSLMEVIL